MIDFNKYLKRNDLLNPNFVLELAKIWQMLKFRVFTKILRLINRLIDGFL